MAWSISRQELEKQINSVILDEHNLEEKRRRENRLKEYEISIMEKSDKLKENARLKENITQLPNPSTNMDMSLNDCDKISTHKNMDGIWNSIKKKFTIHVQLTSSKFSIFLNSISF